MSKFKVTNIQFFDYSSDESSDVKMQYSANIFINNEFVIQVSGNEYEAEKASFPPNSVCFIESEEIQEAASEKYEINEIIDSIEKEGFENNFYYLEENGEKI